MKIRKEVIYILGLIGITACIVAGCSGAGGSGDAFRESVKSVPVSSTEESAFVQTGATRIYNPQTNDTYLITLYDKDTGVEYIMIRQGEMVSIQPRFNSDGNILLHKKPTEEK